MLFAVSTVKDSPENVERFVERNLAGGADHLVVVLDDPHAPETAAVLAALSEHPHVTPLLADEAYWNGERPHDLNARQMLNANLVNTLLAPFPWVEWLFHIDADEVLEIDRARLLAEVPADQSSVVLEPVEAVSREHQEGEVTRFKRLLTAGELELLVALGVIGRADNRDHFRGHTRGKPGVRPALELNLQLHRVVDEEGEPVTPFRAEWLRLRHYESYDAAEFVRKWTAHDTAGTLRFRSNRERLHAALHSLFSLDLPAAKRDDFLMRIYRRWIEDDEATLGDLGLLVELPPGNHRPEPLADERRGHLHALLAALVGAGKSRLHPASSRGRAKVELLDELRPGLPPDVADQVAAEVSRAVCRDRSPVTGDP